MFHVFIVWLGGLNVLCNSFGSPANEKIVSNQQLPKYFFELEKSSCLIQFNSIQFIHHVKLE